MKSYKVKFSSLKINTFFMILILFISNAYAQIDLENRSKLIKPETNITDDLLWHVKAFRPDAQILMVKAIDKKGKIYDVKAIQSSESSSSVLSIKAIVLDKYLPIKIILPKDNNKYFPLVAINENGTLLKIVAINDKGKYLEVRGHSKSGNIINISAITEDNMGYNIIAISPFGEVNTVVGMKMLENAEEAVINGVSVYAHVKAIN